ncbi:chromosome segregation in meiosis protein 3 [Colletotrichum higginsianum]|uniref:Chromosome segregation in meiosis protein n=2 Tax=Colletotrichum higginsianum TaxID=80884 RepID=H1W241_COLHI|nr:Chromosome segregation in meiosis protein 3 [Colletotrichum higginsianum IMI 349063]OBR08916.1 Chromosome segregation in meiosis protein 3 [Colletotrichum higginsianum IMI 349063]CCF46554.1 chromosome segregation in meiosis protein 3 [Colletotrichum higginsianum]
MARRVIDPSTISPSTQLHSRSFPKLPDRHSEEVTMDSRAIPEYDDLDNYNVDDIDDPFRSPPPEAKNSSTNKRKKAEALGLDEEVEVVKRARVPRVKLDEARLLSENGIPKLRKRAAKLEFKGKGNEFSDAARLLTFYQLWLDDLFPKAKFLDALAMVEKAGHKKQIALKRMDWINEGKPKPWKVDEDNIKGQAQTMAQQNDNIPLAPAQSTSTGQQPLPRSRTPEGGDVPEEDDLYDATPRQQVKERFRPSHEESDGEDLDALMAEANITTKTQDPAVNPGAVEEFADEEAAMAEMDGLW